MNEEKITEVKKTKEKKQRANKKDNAKKSGGFNILDALIILGIVLFAAVIVIVYAPLGIFKFNSDNTVIIYTVAIQGVNADYASNVNIGDVVTDSNGYNLGTVVSDVEIEPHMVYDYRENDDGSGSIVKITHPELVDLVITVSANAKINDDGYTVDGKRIALESEYELVFPGFESKGVCISMSEEKANDVGAGK